MLRLYSDRENRYLSMEDARFHLIGRGGKIPSRSTVLRWASKGCRPRPYLEPVVLRTLIVGSDLLTTAEWCREFEEKRLALHSGGRSKQMGNVASGRQVGAAQKRAAKTLDSLLG